MVLVDSSVWVSVEHRRVSLRDLVPEDEVVAVSPIVLHEVLRGTSGPKRYEAARELLLHAEMLDGPTPVERFEEAARLYLVCRTAGVTPSTADCLVAATAIAHDVPLLHRDADFDRIAEVTPLRIFNPSRP